MVPDSPTLRLHKRLVVAGIPVHGVSGRPPDVRIDFKAEATDAQKAQAQALANNHPWAQRTLRPAAAVAADLEAWAGVDPLKVRRLAALLVARLMQDDPGFARRHNIPVDGTAEGGDS
jgi:hypothetical protein